MLSELRRRSGDLLRRRPDAAPGPASETIETISASPLFDQAWVEAQLDDSFPDRDAAVAAYLRSPGCSPHPLFLPDFVRPSKDRPRPGVDVLTWYLAKPGFNRNARTHPLLDLDALREQQPAAAACPDGPVAGWLRGAGPDDLVPVRPGSTPVTLRELRERSIAAVGVWRADVATRDAPRTTSHAPRAGASGAPRAAGSGAQHIGTLVSVVMPVWDRATVVREAIASVQAQTLDSWELLVVDDGSTDDGLQVIEGIAHFDPRVRVLPRPHGGVCRARNEALAQARGEFVAFLDSDNTWEPDFLDSVVGQLQAHGWDMAHGALRATTADGVYYRTHEGTLDDLLVANYIDLNVLVVRRTLLDQIGGFDETLRRGVDWDLVLRLASRSPLHLVPVIGVDYDDDATAGTRISDTEPSTWLSVVASKHLTAHHAHRGPRDRPRSLVLRAPDSLRAVTPVVDLAARTGADLVVVGTRLSLQRHVALQLLVDGVGGRLVRLQVDRGPETAINVGLAAARGRRVVVSTSSAVPDDASLTSLFAALDDPAVRVAVPTVIGADGLVRFAGATVAARGLPVPYLTGHSTADLPDHDVNLPRAMGPVFAGRTDELLSHGGLDPLMDGVLAEVDLTQRMSGDADAVRLLSGARIEDASPPPHAGPAQEIAIKTVSSMALLSRRGAGGRVAGATAWSAAGFEVVGFDYPLVASTEPAPQDDGVRAPRIHLRTSRVDVVEGTPRLRWTIDTASVGGPAGRFWGDTHYAEQLAASLRNQGQHVAIDRRDVRHRATRDLDDVVLVLRGLDRVAPRPGPTNAMWVISHPDEVTAAEAAGYDLVFAASESWALSRSRDWGRAIHPLLQATDPSRFVPPSADVLGTGHPVLFVGNSRNVFRSSLHHAKMAGVDVAVYGRGWKQFLGDEGVVANFVENQELSELYSAAGVVLNDHWDDMRAGGFVSNRLMDAVAAGACVLSDEVDDVDLGTMFHGMVLTYRTAAELADLVRRRAEVFPAAPARLDAARQVAHDHSFDLRARTLVEAVVRSRRS